MNRDEDGVERERERVNEDIPEVQVSKKVIVVPLVINVLSTHTRGHRGECQT